MKKVAALFLVLGAFLLPTTAAFAGSISGTVTGTDGTTPLVNIDVYSYRWDGSEWSNTGVAFTDADGHYEIGGLQAGTHRMIFYDSSGCYLIQTYAGVPGNSIGSGTDVVVVAGETTTDINASLAQAAGISGTVTGPDGTTPLEDIYIYVFQWDEAGEYWDSVVYDYTDENGLYAIGGLNAGTYRVEFYDENGEYLAEYYDNAPDIGSAADIVAPAGTTVSNIDASLVQAAGISGTVTGPDGTTPLEGIQAWACLWNEDGENWYSVGASDTDENGFYAIGGLNAGTYRVGFRDWNGEYLAEYYDNMPGIDSAVDIAVPASTVVPNIDASLAQAAGISGTVTGPDGTTPLEDIRATAYLWDEAGEYWDSVGASDTDENGFYAIGGLNAGTYRVVFYDENGEYLAEYYDNAPDIGSAADIVAPAGTTVSNIDASLAQAAGISGTVTGPDGTTPLEGIRATAYIWDEAGEYWDSVDYDYTDENGFYAIGGLDAGTYRVGFRDWNGEYVTEYYDNAPDIGSAADVTVPASTVVPNIDASLALGGKISGTVTGPDGTPPLEGIQADAYSWNSEYGYWEWITSANTDPDGYYEIGGLAPGTYRVEFHGGIYYQQQAYDGAYDWFDGQDILIVGSETVGDIDASLAAAGAIAGRVTGADGTTGLQDIYARSYLWNGSYWQDMGGGWSDADGCYEIGGLAAGTYRVVFNDWNGGYLSETYDDVPGTDPSRGANMVVVVGETTGGIDAALALESRISGTVTGPGAVALANVQVESYRWDGTAWGWAGWTTTDANGHYEIGDLPAGTYRLDFEPGGDYVPASLADVVVAAEALSENNDVELQAYARLSGTVFLADGVTPVGGVRVYVRDGASNMVWRQSGVDGSYVFSGLRPGNYTVFAAPAPNLGLLGEWYDDAGLYVPGQNVPPPEAAVIALDYGDVRAGVDFDLDPAGRISGTVTAEGGLPLDGACVKAKNGTYGLIRETVTDETGAYELLGLLPGDHTLKAGAEDYRDEWWSEAVHESEAVPFDVASGDDLVRDFDLASGQSPARVEVTSDPSGAAIFVNFQATTSTTPAVIDVGELGVALPGGFVPAPHVFAVRKNGHPRAAPQSLTAIEAETVEVHFDLTDVDAGSLAIQTDPAGAAVYVDYAGSGEGTTPVEVANLAPGSHVILLKADGYLQAKPVVAWVENGSNTAVSVPLAPIYSADRIQAEIQSAPTGAVIYVDYLPTPDVTDAVVDWMDPASHAGSGWHSASHAVMLRKQWHVPAAAYYVPDQVNVGQSNRVELIEDLAAALDEDDDGMPDQLEAPYQDLEGWGSQGPNDDYDGDGVSNLGEMIAGTRADDPDSVLEISATDAAVSGASITLTFHSVPGNRYFIRGASALAGEPEWINLGGVVLASETETTLTVPLPEGMDIRFVQLVVWAP